MSEWASERDKESANSELCKLYNWWKFIARLYITQPGRTCFSPYISTAIKLNCCIIIVMFDVMCYSYTFIFVAISLTWSREGRREASVRVTKWNKPWSRQMVCACVRERDCEWVCDIYEEKNQERTCMCVCEFVPMYAKHETSIDKRFWISTFWYIRKFAHCSHLLSRVC